MFSVYVIESLKNKKRYVGYTRKSAEIRLIEHNNGCNQWSRYNHPFKIIHQEEYENLHEATQRERFLKSGKGREWLKIFLPG